MCPRLYPLTEGLYRLLVAHCALFDSVFRYRSVSSWQGNFKNTKLFASRGAQNHITRCAFTSSPQTTQNEKMNERILLRHNTNQCKLICASTHNKSDLLFYVYYIRYYNTKQCLCVIIRWILYLQSNNTVKPFKLRSIL